VVREDGYTLRPAASSAHSNKVNWSFCCGSKKYLFLILVV